jgi:hypothetical protein
MTEPTEYLSVSYSSLNLADSCLRKFEFNKLYPRRARDADAYAADVGTALHHGYQTFLATQSHDKALWALLESFPYESEFNQTRDDRSLEAAISTLEEMLDDANMIDWELMTIRRPDGEIVPAVEVPFSLRLKGINLPDGRGVEFTGFMDAAMRHRTHGHVRTLDIKTHRRYLEDATSKYRYDSQQVPYGICLEHIQGHRVEEFEVLYLDCFVDLAAPRVHLYPFMKDSTDLQEWLINTVMRVQRIQRAMEMDYFPRTDGGCLSWNRPCYFLEVCQTRDRAAIEEWLLMGEEPEQRPRETPWIVAEIDVFGES